MEGIKYYPQASAKAGADFTSASAKPAITIDYALYDQYLEGMDLTEFQKREFLDTLWSIIVNFVDLGFGVHPLQLAMEASSNAACDKDLELAQHISNSVVSSKQSQRKPNQRKKIAASNKATSIDVVSTNKKLMP